jgi:hypothetical protein
MFSVLEEECTAFIFKVTELVSAEVMGEGGYVSDMWDCMK